MRLFGKVVLVLLIAAGFGVGNDFALAEPHDELVPLLVNVKGWKAEDGRGVSMEGAARGGKKMKMISARRVYRKDKKQIDVSIMVNSGSPSENQVSEYSMDTGTMSMKTVKDGLFWVSTTFNKTNHAGQVFVSLAHNQDTHSLLNLGFVNMTPKEAVAFAKQFKWKLLQSKTEKLL